MEALKTVKLLGAAGRKFGREFKLAVRSPAEAVRAIEANCPGFHAWILEQHQRGVVWRVVTDNAEGLDEEGLKMETGSPRIVLAPMLIGAGGGGFSLGKILLGVALVAVAVFVPAATLGLSSMLGVGLLGGSLILSGVADLMTPTPKLSGPRAGPNRAGTGYTRTTGTEAAKSADLESNLFSRSQGTSAQGECVPLLYGQRRVQSPRAVSFELGLISERDIDTGGTSGLLGYVEETDL